MYMHIPPELSKVLQLPISYDTVHPYRTESIGDRGGGVEGVGGGGEDPPKADLEPHHGTIGDDEELQTFGKAFCQASSPPLLVKAVICPHRRGEGGEGGERGGVCYWQWENNLRQRRGRPRRKANNDDDAASASVTENEGGLPPPPSPTSPDVEFPPETPQQRSSSY